MQHTPPNGIGEPEIVKMLVLSTIHVREETAERLATSRLPPGGPVKMRRKGGVAALRMWRQR